MNMSSAHNMKEQKIKDEPSSCNEMEEQSQHVGNIKVENPEETRELDDIDVKNEFANEDIITEDPEDGTIDVDLEEIKHEILEVTYDNESEDAAPAVNSELQRPIHAGTQDTTTRPQYTATRAADGEGAENSDLSAYSERRFELAMCEGFDGENKNVDSTISDMKLFKCIICRKTFVKEYNFKKHLNKHGEAIPIECVICGKRFRTKGHLDRHLRTHYGVKPFQCTICEKSFSQQAHLKTHLRQHSGEKPFECDVCKRSFSLNSTLKLHLRTHSGEKPFHCEICRKAFAQRQTLRSHLRTHFGEKPYECGTCLKRFTQKSALETHYRIHIKEKPFECDLCRKTFTQKIHLIKHLKKHQDNKI